MLNKNKLTFVLFVLCAILMACAKSKPNDEVGGVKSIVLDETLAGGVKMIVGQKINVSNKIALLPESTVQKKITFESSDPNVAIVDENGDITAKAKGKCEIKVLAGNKFAKFIITVDEQPLVPATSIEILLPELNLTVDEHYNLLEKISTKPSGVTEKLVVRSSDSQIVSVDEDGVLEGVFEGKVIVTVSSMHNPEVKATLVVNVLASAGDYNRDGWTMAASQNPLFKSTDDSEKNSLSSALDGDFSTNFCLVRPGKNFGNNPKVEIASGGELYFIIDMVTPKEVNYFRILHRNKTQTFIRWFGFDKILGSNDGNVFSEITSNVLIPEAGIADKQESANIVIPKCKYRYLKFYAKTANCFYQSSFTSQGASVQIQELYLGLKP